ATSDNVQWSLDNLIRTVQFVRLHEVNHFEALRSHQPWEARDQLSLVKVRLARSDRLLSREIGKLLHQLEGESLARVTSFIAAIMSEYTEVEASVASLLAMTQQALTARQTLPSTDHQIAQLVEQQVELMRHHLNPVVGPRIPQLDSLVSPQILLDHIDLLQQLEPRQEKKSDDSQVVMKKRVKRAAAERAGLPMLGMIALLGSCSVCLVGTAFAVRSAMRQWERKKNLQKMPVQVRQYDYSDEEEQEMEFDEFLDAPEWNRTRCGFYNPADKYFRH
ncbi:hypothetical protein Ciccas_012142, partial [Cichlidogyrus casuarinus]